MLVIVLNHLTENYSKLCFIQCCNNLLLIISYSVDWLIAHFSAISQIQKSLNFLRPFKEILGYIFLSMIRNIHISNYLSCSSSGQITKVLLYCHDCVYIYWAFHNYSTDSLFSPILVYIKGKLVSYPGFLLGIFSEGTKSIVMQISIVILLFSDQISGRCDSFQGDKLPQGAPPAPPPPVEESQYLPLVKANL